VVLLGLAALHQDGKALEVGDLRTELEGDGNVGEVGHLDIGTALVLAGALVAEENDILNAAGLAAEIVLDVALVGLPYQLRHKQCPLLLGAGVGSVALRAGRARSTTVVATAVTISLIMMITMPPVVVARLSTTTVRSVAVVAAARTLPVVTILGPRA